MKTTNIKIKEVTNEQMINSKDGEYNISIWNDRVKRMIELKAKFYKSAPENGFKYNRYYVTYTLDGLNFFKTFSPFHSSITSAPFVKAFIIDGEVFTELFKFQGCEEGAISKSKEGRLWLKNNVCNRGTLITSEF